MLQDTTTSKSLKLKGTAANLSVGGSGTITGALAVGGTSNLSGDLNVTGTLTVGGSTVYNPNQGANVQLPGDHGAIAWSFDPAQASSTTALTNGTIYLVRLPIRGTSTISKVWWGQTVAPNTPTSGQNFTGIYDASGNLLSSVNIDGKTTAGVQSATLAVAQNVSATYIWAAFMWNATTAPTVMRAGGQIAAGNVFNQTAASYRFAVNGTTTGLTALPSTITPASNSQTGVVAMWAAVS